MCWQDDRGFLPFSLFFYFFFSSSLMNSCCKWNRKVGAFGGKGGRLGGGSKRDFAFLFYFYFFSEISSFVWLLEYLSVLILISAFGIGIGIPLPIY